MMASPPPPPRQRLLEVGGAAFDSDVLTAFTVTYDQAEHFVPYAYEPGLSMD